ncbi:MAG: hypothetical protein JXB25_00705 [Deltaproteobacteria bacterium]|nr:hypothetical protein [Deltaproteobacteria bacterium]
MTADVEQHDLLFGNEQSQGNANAGCEANRVTTGQLSAQRVQVQPGLEWIGMEFMETPFGTVFGTSNIPKKTVGKQLVTSRPTPHSSKLRQRQGAFFHATFNF